MYTHTFDPICFRNLYFLDEFNIDDDKDRYVCIVCINAYNFESNRVEWKARENGRKEIFIVKVHILLLGNCDDGGKE